MSKKKTGPCGDREEVPLSLYEVDTEVETHSKTVTFGELKTTLLAWLSRTLQKGTWAEWAFEANDWDNAAEVPDEFYLKFFPGAKSKVSFNCPMSHGFRGPEIKVVAGNTWAVIRAHFENERNEVDTLVFAFADRKGGELDEAQYSSNLFEVLDDGTIVGDKAIWSPFTCPWPLPLHDSNKYDGLGRLNFILTKSDINPLSILSHSPQPAKGLGYQLAAALREVQESLQMDYQDEWR